MELMEMAVKGYIALLDLTLPIHNDDTFTHTHLWQTFVKGSENKQIQKLVGQYSSDRIEATIDIVVSIFKPFSADIDLLMKQWVQIGQFGTDAIANTLAYQQSYLKESEIDNAFYM